MTRDDLLAEYRRLQRAEGATEASERALAYAQGVLWERYAAACKAEGVAPESMDDPEIGFPL